jgi:uncharacterized protein (DUF2237 family)
MFLAALLPVARMIQLPDISAMAVAIQAHLTAGFILYAIMSDAFLEYSKAAGNDLSTPHPEFGFSGLKAGDQWCLCAARWEQARADGKAPKVRLAATNQVTLAVCQLDDLKAHAIDLN